jgi:hypothetical protein
MSRDLEVAKECMLDEGYTCVVVKGEQVYTSVDRGVKPLVAWLDSGTDLRGFAAADKVIGNGAAMLYVLLGVKEIYTPVISQSAKATLDAHGIAIHFEACVEGIVNRAGTGPCPMEDAVQGIDDPKAALVAIRKRLQELCEG